MPLDNAVFIKDIQETFELFAWDATDNEINARAKAVRLQMDHPFQFDWMEWGGIYFVATENEVRFLRRLKGVVLKHLKEK